MASTIDLESFKGLMLDCLMKNPSQTIGTLKKNVGILLKEKGLYDQFDEIEISNLVKSNLSAVLEEFEQLNKKEDIDEDELPAIPEKKETPNKKEKKEKKKKTEKKSLKKQKVELPDGWETDSDGNPYISLTSDTRVTISTFRGNTNIDIRKFFKGNPTKKGISLSPALFKDLVSKYDDIQSVYDNV